MAATKLYGRDLKEYEDIDIDELLAKLTPEQIEELGQELIDPDDSHIPPSERCRYTTDKEPTGPYSRKALLDFLETKAKEDKDWEEAKPYTKETRGKIWKPKEEEKIQINEDEDIETEWDEVLASATEEELVDLAAIMGFHGMLNQVQYHNAFVENKDPDEIKAGFQGIAKHQDFKLVQLPPPNDTNVEGSLKQLKDNDPKLKELNLNNIKQLTLDKLCEFGEALKDNTHLERLEMANTRATDRVAKAIAESLKNNKTLLALNLESNYISGVGIIALLENIHTHQMLLEFRVANQRPQVLGVKSETAIAQLMKDNNTLLKFGIFLEVPNARIHVQEYLQRNHDILRRKRTGELPADYKPPIPKREEKVFRKREDREREAAEKVEAKKEEPKKETPKKKETTSEESSSEEETSDEEEEE